MKSPLQQQFIKKGGVTVGVEKVKVSIGSIGRLGQRVLLGWEWEWWWMWLLCGWREKGWGRWLGWGCGGGWIEVQEWVRERVLGFFLFNFPFYFCIGELLSHVTKL